MMDDEFLKFMIQSKSQYDETCRSLAKETLKARKKSRLAEAKLAGAIRLARDLWAHIPTGLDCYGDLSERFVSTVKGAPGQARVAWTDQGRTLVGSLSRIESATVFVIGEDGAEHTFPSAMIASGELKFTR